MLFSNLTILLYLKLIAMDMLFIRKMEMVGREEIRFLLKIH